MRELKRLARRIADSVAGGEAQVIRKPLNSFERRIVHMEIADMDGVDGLAEIDGERKVRIFADNGEGSGAERKLMDTIVALSTPWGRSAVG